MVLSLFACFIFVELAVIGYGSCMGFVRAMMSKVIFGVGPGTGSKMVLASFTTVAGGNRCCIVIFRI